MIKEIAKYIVDAGNSNTESGNWHITFDEVNSLFGTNLPENVDMLGKIQDHIIENYPDMVADIDCSEDFDVIFYTDCCPNCVDEHEP